MSEERLQEIKDSVNFQREILLAHNMRTLCVDEEQELIDEIERLNNIINELEQWLEKSDFRCPDDLYVSACDDTLNKIKELKESDK